MRSPRGSRLLTGVLAGLLTLGLVAGCGGGSSKPKASAFNETAAKAQITSNFEAFFDPKGTTAQHVALLQDGPALQKAIEAQANNPLAKSAKTTVTNVVIDPSHTSATVTYDIAVNGNKVITGGEGHAVLENGTWKVSRDTFCGLANAGTPGTCPT